MKEKLYTIPVNEGFEAEDECPFCAMERKEEQRAIRYFAGPGASYMEPDVRASTDKAGFCGAHMKKLYDYGNALGCALMLQTYYAGLLEEMQAAVHPDRIYTHEDIALVATVGHGMAKNVGTSARLFKALSDAHINVNMIDQGSSELNIIVGVESADCAGCIQAIYNEFFN